MQLPTLSLLSATLVLLVTASPVRFAKRSPSAPHFVVYWDEWVSGENGPPDPSVVQGFNVFILSFLLASGTAADQAQEWASLDQSARSSIKSAYSDAGIQMMVSAFGSTDSPTSAGYDAVLTANSMASWVKSYNLDGIDVDYEDFGAIGKSDGSAENWLITFTQTLRNALPSPDYIITHAPVAPWFSPIYLAGAYTGVHRKVGSLIDWYNVQFYNQGTEYTTCDGLLTASSSHWPNSSVFQISSTAGVPLDKIVVGKPGTAADANNGFMDASTLSDCVSAAKRDGWTGGIVVWQYPDANSSWITQVRASSWPVGDDHPSASTSSTATQSSSTTAPASGTTTPASSTTTPASGTTTPTSGTTTPASSPTTPASSPTTLASSSTTPASGSITLASSTTAPASSTSIPASSTTTPAPSATTSPLPSTTPRHGRCEGVSTWSGAIAYNEGHKVTYQGHLWQAKCRTEADVPGGSAGVWEDLGDCQPGHRSA
ncbi:glycoside hydrolase superfamily [Cantharellus anzutake]|uniref:glycoside hydrolase superfamily n=1 Tax=Cantharellus anzutake TaxID=1750568 RepID=UPI001903EB84|nr:glycoside hydrolase superfamily [Cantharellus anzutake]KAF8327704.1 glycoside hydrolase superfamily [Cantharellus anzutake]